MKPKRKRPTVKKLERIFGAKVTLSSRPPNKMRDWDICPSCDQSMKAEDRLRQIAEILERTKGLQAQQYGKTALPKGCIMRINGDSFDKVMALATGKGKR